MKLKLFGLILAVAVLVAPGGPGDAQEQFPFQIFERYLEPLVQQIGRAHV